MGEPRAITFKEVEKAAGPEGNALELWEKIGRMTGAGVPSRNHDGDASIDLTSTSDSMRERVDKLLAGAEDDREESKTAADSKPAAKGKEK